jgi:hypothetical protein
MKSSRENSKIGVSFRALRRARSICQTLKTVSSSARRKEQRELQ